MIMCTRDVKKYSKSPISTPFNVFKALDDHECSVSIGSWHITNFSFADGIVVNADEDEEAGVLKDRLDTTTTKLTKKSDDKQPKRLPKRYQNKQSEARSSGELQVLGINHLK